MKKKLNKKNFRVTIFGSARIKEGDPRYKMVYSLAKMIAKEGMDIVTGGGPGLMNAASEGHYKGDKKNKLQSIGLTIKLPHEQSDAKHLDIKKEFKRFSGRLDTFMSLSNAVVVAPGGIGTLLELVYTWQLVQIKHICETPIILLGDMWIPLIDWIKKTMVRCGLVSKKDLNPIFFAKTPSQAIKILKRVREDSKKPGHVCQNFNMYRSKI